MPGANPHAQTKKTTQNQTVKTANINPPLPSRRVGHGGGVVGTKAGSVPAGIANASNQASLPATCIPAASLALHFPTDVRRPSQNGTVQTNTLASSTKAKVPYAQTYRRTIPGAPQLIDEPSINTQLTKNQNIKKAQTKKRSTREERRHAARAQGKAAARQSVKTIKAPMCVSSVIMRVPQPTYGPNIYGVRIINGKPVARMANAQAAQGINPQSPYQMVRSNIIAANPVRRVPNSNHVQKGAQLNSNTQVRINTQPRKSQPIRANTLPCTSMQPHANMQAPATAPKRIYAPSVYQGNPRLSNLAAPKTLAPPTRLAPYVTLPLTQATLKASARRIKAPSDTFAASDTSRAAKKTQAEKATRREAKNVAKTAKAATKTNNAVSSKTNKRTRTRRIVLNVIFVVVVASICVAIVGVKFLTTGEQGKGAPISIAGYSVAVIASDSMSNTYPKGTLVVSKQVDAKDLKEGDDITFLTPTKTSITHRIVGVYRSEDDNQNYLFQTQGTMNGTPDEVKVSPENIVGKVVFSSAALGWLIECIKAFWPVIVLWIALTFAVVTVVSKVGGNTPAKHTGRPGAREGPKTVDVSNAKIYNQGKGY